MTPTSALHHYDVIIIGAGAAGLMCAGAAIQRGRSVLVIDHAKTIGEKIRISGGGRCNFTNLNCSPRQFISANAHFCKSALSRYTQQDFVAMVNRHGIAWHEKTLGQLFCDGSSQQIIDMLLRECHGARIVASTAVTRVEKTESGFRATVAQESFTATSLVVATGGLSIPKIGASGFGYDLARQFGINVIPPVAALVPLTFQPDTLAITKELSGVSVDTARVQCNGAHFDEALLFTHRGLSGPSILQISSYWSGGDAITLTLCPSRDILNDLKAARTAQPRKMVRTVLAEVMPQRLAEAIVTISGVDGPMADQSDKKLRAVAAQVQDWRIFPAGTEGYRTAEVTRGGVDTDALSSKTFEAKTVPGLYFIGEVVDVTGWLGGYNFQWAWSSGWCAGQFV